MGKALYACVSYDVTHTSAAVLMAPLAFQDSALAALTRSRPEVYAAGGVVHKGAIYIAAVHEPPCIQVPRAPQTVKTTMGAGVESAAFGGSPSCQVEGKKGLSCAHDTPYLKL